MIEKLPTDPDIHYRLRDKVNEIIDWINATERVREELAKPLASMAMAIGVCVCGSRQPSPLDFDEPLSYQVAIRDWKAEHHIHLYGTRGSLGGTNSPGTPDSTPTGPKPSLP